MDCLPQPWAACFVEPITQLLHPVGACGTVALIVCGGLDCLRWPQGPPPAWVSQAKRHLRQVQMAGPVAPSSSFAEHQLRTWLIANDEYCKTGSL